MKTNELNIKGNGETVRITLSGYRAGNFLTGRIFRVTASTFDVIETKGKNTTRVALGEIAAISAVE